MEHWKTVTEAAQRAMGIPLYPSPARGQIPCAVYTWQPSGSDGALSRAHMTVRVFASDAASAAKSLDALCGALIADGDSGVIGEGDGTLTVCETAADGGYGYIRGAGIYYVQAGFDIQGRA